jgi:hypothetical protein
MEGLSRQLYDSIPQYARWIDEKEILLHICEAFQVELDLVAEQIAARQYFFDTDIIPDSALPFVAQLVGAGTVGNKWLGIGMNPDWESSHKRIFIQRLWTYWQIKGTPIGVREAFFLWLQFERTYSEDALKIVLPFGKTPTKHPPLWWNYSTLYGASEQQSLIEKQYFGSGEYDQIYTPNWEQKELGDSFSRTTEQTTPGSRLGANSPHFHFFPTKEEWNIIFPSVHELLPEITAANARNSVFGWIPLPLITLDLERNQDLLLRRNLRVDGMKYGEDPQGGTILPIPLPVGEEERSPGIETVIGAANVVLRNVFGLWSRRIIISETKEVIPLDETSYSIEELFPGIRDILNPNKWFLEVETSGQKWFRLKPISCFFDRETRRNQIVLNDTNLLIIEFAFCPKINSSVSGISLYSSGGDSLVTSEVYSPELSFSENTILGIKIKLRLNTGYLDPGIVLVQNKDEIILVRGGEGETYFIFLKSPPTAPVVIVPSLTEGLSISPEAITFTDQDWQIPQTITVIADAQEGYIPDEYRSIIHTVNTEDDAYNTIPVTDVDILLISSIPEPLSLTFENQDRNALFPEYQQLTFENQDRNALFPEYQQLTFENQDKFALIYQYLIFENQDRDALLPEYEQLTFENQDRDALLPEYEQLTFENQDIGAL